MNEHKEIYKLRDMLAEHKIAYQLNETYIPAIYFKAQLKYPLGENPVCSIIEGKGTYGGDEDKLEIMGLLTDEETERGYDVVGWLTAEEVFKRIAEYEESRNGKNENG